MIKSLILKIKIMSHKVLIEFLQENMRNCVIVKYPDAPLPLEILKSIN